MPNTLTRKESALIWLGVAVWLAGLLTAIGLTLATDPPPWLPPAVAAVAVAGLILTATVVARSGLRSDGVERTVNIEASALAFWITMGALLTYSLIDAFGDVPAIRASGVLFFGLIAWSAAQAARLRRYS